MVLVALQGYVRGGAAPRPRRLGRGGCDDIVVVGDDDLVRVRGRGRGFRRGELQLVDRDDLALGDAG